MIPNLETSKYKVPLTYIAPYMDGVFLAVNAIPDSYLVYHVPDCGYFKDEKITASHDLFSNLLRWDKMNRIVRTNIGTRDFIMGGEGKLAKKLLQVVRRDKPSVVFVARSNTVLLSGEDVEPIVREAEKKAGVPFVLIPEWKIDMNYVTGYGDALDGYLAKLEFSEVSGKRPVVAVTGYMYERHEGDHQGNIAELKRMLSALGFNAQVFLDGQPCKRHRETSKPVAVVDLNSDWEGGRELAQKIEGPYIDAGLPLGIEGSLSWISKVAQELNVEKRAAQFIDSEMKILAPRLQWLLPSRFFGCNVALFADHRLLKPLGAFLEELGMNVIGTGCTSQDALNNPESESHPALPYPSLPIHSNKLREFAIQARKRGDLDLVIGNALIRQTLANLFIPVVEMGYPSNFHHDLLPRPTLGFQGVLGVIERMLNSLLSSEIRFDPQSKPTL